MKKIRWIFFSLICLILVSACRPIRVSQAEKVVMAFMDTMIDGDLEKSMDYIIIEDKEFSSYVSNWQLPESLLANRDYLREINLAHMENLSYSLELIKEDKDEALVAVKVNRKDLKGFDDLFDGEKLDDKMVESIIGRINSVKDYKDLEGLIKLKKEDKDYYIDFIDGENIKNLRKIFFEE